MTLRSRLILGHYRMRNPDGLSLRSLQLGKNSRRQIGIFFDRSRQTRSRQFLRQRQERLENEQL